MPLKSTKYNELNQAYYTASAEVDKQDEIIKNTKGSTIASEQEAYAAAVTAKAAAQAEAVAATDAINAWTAQNQDFTTALGQQRTELGVFKSTGGAVSVGATTYTSDGRVSSILLVRSPTSQPARLIRMPSTSLSSDVSLMKPLKKLTLMTSNISSGPRLQMAGSLRY